MLETDEDMKDDLFLTEQYENEDREIDTFVISFNNLLGSLGPMPDISTIKRPQPLLPPPPPPPPTTTTATSSYNKPSSSGALLTLSSSPVKKLGADRVGSIGSRRTACRPTTAPTTRLQHHHPLSHQSDAHASKIYRPKSAGIFPASGRRLAGEFENNGKPIELSSVRLQKGLKRATKRANSLNAKTFFSVSASSTASIEANSVQAPRLINGGGGARCGIVAQTQRKQSATSFDQELLSRLHATAEADKAPAIYQDNAGVSSPGDFQQYESGQWRDKSRPQSAVISRVQSRPESAIATFSRPISAKTITRPRSAYSTRTFSSRPSSSFMRASSAASNSSSGYTPVYEARFNELKSVSDNVLDQANRKSILEASGMTESTLAYLNNQQQHKQKFPLEWFDDPEFETRSGSEWVLLSKNFNKKGAVAVSRFFSYPESELEWKWAPCNVIDYDSKSDFYIIEWTETKQQKQVKRLNLLFEEENRERFFRRLEYAVKMRSETEFYVNHWESVRSRVPSASVSRLPNNIKKSLIAKFEIYENKNYEKSMKIVKSCLQELDEEWNMSMRKATFDYMEGEKHHDSVTTKVSEKFARDALEKSGTILSDEQGELMSHVALGAKGLSNYLFTANANIQRAIIKILSILPSILGESSSRFALGKDISFPCSFHNFKRKINFNGQMFLSTLKNEWIMEIARVIETSLGDFFKLTENSLSVYRKSRCNNFLQLINIIMETQLRTAVVEEMIKFLNLFKIEVSKQVVDAFEKGIDIHYSVGLPKEPNLLIPKLLVLSVLVQDQSVALEPPISEIEQSILSTFTMPRDITHKSLPHIETLILRNLFMNSEDCRLISTFDDESFLVNGIDKLRTTISYTYQTINDIINRYKRFEFLMKEELEDAALDDLDADISIFRAPLRKYCWCISSINQVTHDLVDLNPFILDCSLVKKTLLAKALECRDWVVSKITNLLRTVCIFLVESYQEFFDRVLIDPGVDASLWQILSQTLVEFNEEKDMYMTQVNDIKQMWEIMYENNISIDDNISELYWKTCSWPPKLDEEVKRATKRLAESRSQIISQISLDQEHAVSSITAYFNELDQFEGISNLSMTFNVYDNVKSLRLRIDRVFALIESISTREILISDVKFSLPMATVLLQNFESYENMWKTVDDMTNTMERWIESYFMDLNSDEMMEKMETWRSVLRKVLPEFAGSKHNSEAIVLKMKAKLDDFSRYTNVLIALLNPALREKHWSQISSIVGISLSDVQGLRLRDVMELDLELVQDIVGDISKDASSDFVLDASLESMKHELSSHEFFIKEFKSEICTIENLKDCLAMCEDHLMKSEALLASARSNALIVRIKTWTKKLFKTQEILEAWSYLQTLFVDIYPVTELPDFEYKLEPSEVENFHAVKKLMVMLSDILVKNRKFVTVVLRSDLYDLFLSAQSRIDRLVCISRKMLDHLRLKFNRFYLLNYDEITDVLGGSSDVSKIHRHLPKLFDNIHRLIKFAPKRSNKAFVTHTAEEDVNGQDEGVGGDQSLDVGSSFNRERRRSSRFSMISKRDNLKNRFFLKPDEKKDDGLGSVYGFSSLEGERIQLIESVKVTSRAEDWLQQLSDRIKSTIKWHAVEHMREVSNLLDASHHVGKVSFQTSYLVLNLIFTRQVTAILFGTPETLWKDMRKQITKAIEGLVSRLKTISYAAHRSSLENGIILFSEFQNIGDNLLNTEPNFGTQMEWLSLLRYYFESDIITVKCANYFAKYEFEYAGSGVRIMMSQSVNKHYNHIIESLSQSQSCAIIGQDPANKMDFLSEMAKWFGRKSHAINCALRIEEAHLANILYGSLSIGAWVCFENCHNLALEELSILSQHVSTIQRQILMAHKARRPVLTFEGVEFMVDSACTLFLSMDISHTQWENLSSSFKSSFRPVTFTMPDVGVLAETLLYANGFSSCSRMSKKLSILIKCITPLVDHSIRVEVGMKLIEQILHNASHTLRGVGGGGGDSHDYQTTEFLKVSWGVEKTISPLLSPRDVPYLRNILHDVFGYHQVSAELKAHPMLSFVQAAAHSLNLSAHDQFISKVIEIYDGIVSNQVVVIVGKSMSGKSSLLKTLEAALNLKANGQTAFHVFKCFPNMLRKMENVFGYHKEEVWIDGVLTDSLKAANRQAEEIIDELEAHKGSQDFYSCLLVEGRLKRELLERMLNGTEKVSGASLNFGETLLLSPRTKLVFETSDVKAWSPVQLARCNIIYVPDTIVKSCHFLPNVLQELPYVLQKHSEFYQHLHSLIFVQLSNFVKTNCRSNLMVCENAATQQVFRMVSSLHLDLGDLGYERLMDFEQYHWILASFLFASIWVVGALTDYQERVVVSDFIRSNVSTKVVREVEKKMGLSASLLTPCVQFPANDTVYEYFFDNKILSWEPWFMLAASDELPDTAGLPVKTDDIIRLKYFTRIMQSQNIPVLITGKLGVGKTITAFQSMLESDEVHGLPVRICLNDSSGGANFSDEIEKSLIKKRNKTLGLMERKNVVALVDDLDSDSFTRFPEQWETWRSWCENSGWYIRNKFTSVENLKLIVIMNHSQRAEDGVKHDRYLRYFWNFAIADDIGNKLSSICKTWIFDTNLESCLTLNGFGLKLVQAASYLNDRVCRMFVKSTSKPHYVFSLKEMTAAIRPLLTERALDSIQILGIWAYNCTRMYIDRLSEETERSRFEEILQDAIKNHFDVHLERIFPMERPLMLGNFGKELIPTNKSPELYPGLYFKSFKETLEVLSKNVTLIVDKQYLTYAQVEEILHHDAFVTAMRIESALQMNSSATLFGIDYEDRAWITRLVCSLNNYSYSQLPPRGRSLDPLNDWKEFVRATFVKALETWRPVVVFIRMGDIIRDDYQLTDLLDIMQFGMIRGLATRLVTAEISETFKNNLKSHGYSLSTLSDNDLFHIFSTHRLVRLVISIDGEITDERFWGLTNSHRWLHRLTSLVWIGKWEDGTISYFADTLIKANFLGGNTIWLQDFLKYTFDFQDKILDMELRITGKRVVTPASCVRTIMATFSNLYVQKSNEFDKRITKINASLSVIKKLFAASIQIELEFISWNKQVHDSTLKCQNCLKHIEAEREVKDRINIEIQIEEDLIKRLLDEKKSLEALYSLELDKVMPAVVNSMKAVDSIKKNDLYEIKSLISPPKSVLMVMEVLCIIFKVEVKSGETAWEGAKRLLSETRFVHNIIGFDKDSLTSSMMHRVALYTQLPEFSSKDIHNISKAVSALASWILALERYHEAVTSLEPKRKLIQDVAMKIDQAELEIRKMRTKKQGVEENLLHLKSNLDMLIRQKESIIRSFKDWEQKSKSSKQMVGVLTTAETRWLKQLSELKHSKVCLLADAMMVSCQVAYFGPYCKEVRDAIRKDWTDWLISREVPSFNQSLGSISEFHVKIPDIFHSCDIVKDVYGLENYFIAKHHDRVPVICDPYESFSSFVSALETNIEPRVVRTEDPKWKDAISDAMRKGYTVLLLATDMLEPDLYLIDFMREYNWYICNKLKLFQDFNGENIEVNKQFKLYVFINQSLNYASFKWTKHTAAVSCSVEVETVSTILLDILLTTCSVKNREQLIHFEIDSINRSNRLLALENRGLEFVLSLNDSDLIGGESFRLITEVEDQIIVTSTYMTSSQRQERDLLTQIVWHTKFSAFCAKVFKTVEKMAKVSAMYAISLSSFISIFKTSIGDITSPTRPTPLESLPLLLLKNVYDSFVYGFERTDAVLFVFMLAIEYNIYIEKKDQLLQITPSLWHYFINGKIHKDVKFPKKWHVDEFPANPSPQYLKRTSWEKILTLSKHPEFFKFAMEFVRYANKATTPPTEANWEDVFKCLDPCSAKFPTRWDSELTKFQRLLVIQCLRPDSIISCIQDYVAESIGDGFLEAPLDSLGVAIKRSLPMTPILLTYSINDDPVKQIKWFASRQNMGNFINIVSFGLVSDKQMDEILEDASKRGKWVVFQNCHLFANKVRLIEQKYRSFQQESRQLQPNFRVWLVSRPYTFFSMYVYTQSTRVHIDSPVTLGQLVEAIFPVLEENIVPHEFRSTISYRSYLLKITILFMSLNARRQYAISSCISDHAFGMSDLQLSVSLLREGFNSYGTSADKQIPKRTLALFGELPFVSKSMDTWDRRLLTTLFNEVMNIDWADGDSFSSADLPFKQILEHMNKNELQQALGLIYDFANFNNPQIFGLNENAIVVGRRVESKTFMKSLMIYDSKSLTMLPLSIWSDQTTIINMIKVHFDRLNDLIQNSAMDFNFKTTSGGGLSELFDSHSKQRHIERVLLDNILRYRSMAKMISFNLTAVIEAHHGRITFTSRIKSMVEDIHCNIIPKEWLISENWYICRFGYKEWFENFLLRLAFIKEWFQTRLESMPEFTGMPMYDISLLYFPQAFLNAVLLDFAANNRESIENVEFDAMILSNKQTSAPDRGVNITGLYLSNATWDFSHNMLKDCKTHEQYFHVQCLWLQPVVRFDAEKAAGVVGGPSISAAKQQAASSIKRNWQKYRCPIYRYRPAISTTYQKPLELSLMEVARIGKAVGDEDPAHTLSDLNLSPTSTESLFVGFIDLTTDVPVKFWVKRNVSIVLEIVGFKSHWGKH